MFSPEGLALITVPMSNGGPFHESPSGDERFAAPYRLYTPAALEDRLLSNPRLDVVRLNYLAQTSPDPRYEHRHFHTFWVGLDAEERMKWAWANPTLSRIFNPIVGAEAAVERNETVNTALVLEEALALPTSQHVHADAPRRARPSAAECSQSVGGSPGSAGGSPISAGARVQAACSFRARP